MGKEEDRALSEAKKKIFDRDIGQKARVERLTGQGDSVLFANEALRRGADFLKEGQPSLRDAEYQGSCAVHIFRFPSLQEIVFVSQTGAIGTVPEVTASAAFEALRGDLMEQYGRARKTKRSGF